MLERFGRGLRRAAAGYVDAINPIRTFGMQQRRKLAAEVATTYVPSHRSMSTEARRVIRKGAAARVGMGDKIKSYFNGYNMDDLAGMPDGNGVEAIPRALRGSTRGPGGVVTPTDRAGKLYAAVAAKRANVRRISAGVLGAATIGTVAFGRDNVVSEGGITATTLGGVGLVAGGMAEYGARSNLKGLGYGGAAALVGWTALNMYRSGDNVGPF